MTDDKKAFGGHLHEGTKVFTLRHHYAGDTGRQYRSQPLRWFELAMTTRCAADFTLPCGA